MERLTDEQLGELALREGIVSPEDLQAVREASRISENRPLSEIMIEMNLISDQQLHRLLKLYENTKSGITNTEESNLPPNPGELFGRIAIERTYATRDQLDECLSEQKTLHERGQAMRLGQIMLKRRVLTTEQFLEVLRLQEKYILSCPCCGSKYFAGDFGASLSCRKCGGKLPTTSLHDDLGKKDSGAVRKSLTSTSKLSDTKINFEGRILGKYKILGEVGRGGLGIVYRALDEPLNRIVALKTLRSREARMPAIMKLFLREAKNGARLNHESIVTLHEVGTVGETSYFTMEFVEGDSLEVLLQKNDIKRDEALRLLQRVAKAVDYAHGEGVFHRNLKPANILVDAQGWPYITDFGLGRHESISKSLTDGVVELGGPQYLAPEQIRGESKTIDQRTDIFALGVILYRIITGRLPFEGDDTQEVCKNILEGGVVRPRQVDPGIEIELETICRRAMERDRALRYANARDFADDLGRYLAGRPVEARPVTVMQRLRRRARRSKAMVVAGVILFAALGSGGYMIWNHLREQAAIRQAEIQARLRNDAEKIFDRAKTDYDVLRTVANMSREQIDKKLAGVLSFLEQARTRDETYGAPYGLRARIRERQGDLDGALEDWDAAVSREEKGRLDARVDRARCRLLRFTLLSGSPLSMGGEFAEPLALPMVRFSEGEPARIQAPWAEAERKAMTEDLQYILDNTSGEEKNSSHYFCADGGVNLAKEKYQIAVYRAGRVEKKNDPHYDMRSLIRAVSFFCYGDLGDAYAEFRNYYALHHLPGDGPVGTTGMYSRGQLEWALTKARGPEAGVLRGLIQQILGKVRDADEEFTNSLERPGARARRATLRLLEGKMEEALRDTEAVLEKNENDLEGLLARAACRVTQGQFQEATVDLEQVLKKNPRDPSALYLRAWCRVELEPSQTDHAKSELKGTMDMLPGFYQGHYLRGRINFRLRNFRGALTDINKALALKKDLIEAIILGAEVHATRQESHLEATQWLTEHMKNVVPDHPELHFRRGLYLLQARKFEEARTDFEVTLAKEPNHLDARLGLIVALYALDGPKLGMEQIEEFLQRNKNYYKGYLSRGDFHFAAGDKFAALADYRMALTLTPPRGAAKLIEDKIRIMEQGGTTQNPVKPETQVWVQHFKKAMGHIQSVGSNPSEEDLRKHYPEAKMAYEDGLPWIPDQLPTSKVLRIDLFVGIYNYACVNAVMARWEKDESTRRYYVDQAIRHLKQALEYGFQDHNCGHPSHRNGMHHAKLDSDFSALRTDSRYQAIFESDE